MQVYLECLPCILRQVLEASKMVTDDADARDQIMEEAIGVLRRYHAYQSPPEIAGRCTGSSRRAREAQIPIRR